MKSKILVFSVVLAAALLSGCSSSVKRVAGGPASPFQLVEDEKISSVSISLSGKALDKAKNNLKFSKEDLKDTIERALAAYELKGTDSPDGTTIEVDMFKVRVRSNFNAVMWGVMAGADGMAGKVKVKDSRGKVLDEFQVSVAYALGGTAGGHDNTRMSWLYEEFAKKLVGELLKD